MNHSQVAKSAPRRSLLPAMLLATLMALTACGGEGTIMTVTTTPPEGASTPADGITAVSIAIEVKKDGELQNEGTISFSTDLGTFDNSNLETPVRKTSVELEMGKASIPLYSVQAGTATVRVEYTDAETGLVDASTELAIDFHYALSPTEKEPKPATIEFISADPETIKIFNTSSEGQTSTKITFQVLDKLNLPIADQQIYFSLPRPLGEASLVPLETKSDVNGYAVTYLTSGRVAGVAEVVASTKKYNEDTTAVGEDFVSGTAKIHVVAGSANYYNFSFGCERTSIGGFKWYGEQMECGAFVADRDTQEIPNQPVLFATEAGAVFPLIYTGSNGQAVTTYTTQDPIPYPVKSGTGLLPEEMKFIQNQDVIYQFLQNLYYFDETPLDVVPLNGGTGLNLGLSSDNGEVNYITPNYYYNQEILVYTGDGPNDGVRDRNPRDGLVTLIAVTGGEEPLLHDRNQNGQCDDPDDSFLSLGEPFIDRNDNGIYDYGEYFLDLDNNLDWTAPINAQSNVPYNIVKNECANWKKNTQIWKEEKILWTGVNIFEGFAVRSSTSTADTYEPGDDVTATGVQFYYGQGVVLDIVLLDRNLNAVASGEGDTIECSMEADIDIEVTPSSQGVSTMWGPVAHGQLAITGVQKDPTQPKPGTAVIVCNYNFSLGDKHSHSGSLKISATVLQKPTTP